MTGETSHNGYHPSCATTETSEDRIVKSVYKYLVQSICIDVAANMHELIKTGAGDVIPSSWRLFSGNKIPNRRELYPELYNGESNSDNEKEKREGGNDATETNANEDHPLKRKRLSDEEIQSVLETYAVDLPTSSSSSVGKTMRSRDMAEEEEELQLLSRIKKEKQSNYKDSDDDDDDDEVTNDDEDEDDEDFKMEDADDDDDDMDGPVKKKKRSLSTSSTPSSTDPFPQATALTDPTNGTTTGGSNRPTSVDIWGKTPAKEPKNRLCRCQICGRLISTSRFASHLDKCMGLSTSRSGGGSSSVSSASMSSTKGSLILSSSIGGGMVTKKKRGSSHVK